MNEIASNAGHSHSTITKHTFKDINIQKLQVQKHES